MHKRFGAFIIFCLLTFHTFPEDQDIITILDFEISGISNSEMRSIQSLINSGLFQTEKYIVIDISERDRLLEEMEFSLSGCTDESCQIEIGKLLSAEYIVVGSIDKVGNKYVIALKILETATSRTASTADGIYLSLDELIDNARSLAFQLAGIEDDTSEIKKPVKTAPNVSFLDIAKFSTLGAGLTAAGIGTYLVITVVGYFNDTVLPSKSLYQAAFEEQEDFDSLYRDYISKFENFKINRDWGIISLSVGGALIVTSVILFIIPPDKKSGNLQAVSISPSGFSVSLKY